ncbi:MAG: hypothetical protein F7C82_03005 [Desulfurococcales archaeon]|nr:hypothetical protein [Desulfurococcales archaeon]
MPNKGPGVILILILMLSSLLPVVPHAEGQGYSWIRECSVYIVAVSSGGGGVAGNLTVRVAYPGSGRVYISTSPASMVDTQGSARIAAFAASLLAGVDMTQYDFFYDIQSDSIIIGGPSAGFAMALATLLALENVTCGRYFAVTGMIQPDTSIGPVGGLKEKLEAASSVGVKLFMIPAGQEVYTYYQTKYERIGPFVRVERVPVSVNLTEYGSELGVRVESVASLEEGFRLVANRSITTPASDVTIPEYAKDAIYSFIEYANSTVDNIVSNLVNADNSYIKKLVGNATSAINDAKSLYDNGLTYQAALRAVNSLEYAFTAMYADQAIENSYKITGIVQEVNATINATYNELSQQTAGLTPLEVETLAKAWAKLAIGAYYYQLAVKMLDVKGGEYYLPISFGGVDPTPLQYLSEGKVLSLWAEFWYNLTKVIPSQGPGVSESRLEQVSRLLEAEARSTTAYLQTLLQEAGADTGKAELPLFLSEQALTTDNPIARIGFSIESIALTTAVIHDTFTLDPVRTATQLSTLASTLYKRVDGDSIQIPLLLGVVYHSDNAKTSVLASSRAVLYGWLAWELSNSNITSTTTTMPPVSETTTTPIQSPSPTSTTPQPTTSETGNEHAMSPAYPLVMGVIAILSLFLGIIIGGLTLRK